MVRCLLRWFRSFKLRWSNSRERSRPGSEAQPRPRVSSTTSLGLSLRQPDESHLPRPHRQDRLDRLKRQEEWGEVLLYLEGVFRALEPELLHPAPGRGRDVVAAEARMVRMIHSWAAEPPEEESDGS